jgi:hypothetical protein
MYHINHQVYGECDLSHANGGEKQESYKKWCDYSMEKRLRYHEIHVTTLTNVLCDIETLHSALDICAQPFQPLIQTISRCRTCGLR